MADRLAEMRASRERGVVLKTAILTVMSQGWDGPICVFEGSEDIGPYEVWIAMVDRGFVYKRVIARGKDQVLAGRRSLLSTSGIDASRVLYFIDFDFDGCRGEATGRDLFCTSAYSVESYLACEQVLESVLLDELQCEHQDVERIVGLFGKVCGEFLDVMRDVNWRLFVACRLRIRVSGKDARLARYADVALINVAARFAPKDLCSLIRLEREPLDHELGDLRDQFSRLAPQTAYRGKFLLDFFLRWLELLGEERRLCTHGLFATARNVGFSVQRLTMRSLATRSPIPEGLDSFIAGARMPQTQG